ncbi:SAF domain-containing protein [Alkalicoccus luteus]|uniref:NAD(P)-dependent oxidoreductase n=1 Tax=Alkalicoccus luteus TaxID=1237094 RepID=A0A969TVU7_9BACI|nr:SAF domain-containing protein [Alkalicoccus luteus]NJP38770.1 NAD(P)-dependent oxidoreductase [Alkalicoccus luteus]
MTKIGISGTGFIATGLYKRLQQDEEFTVSSVLTRRKPEDVVQIETMLLTNDIGKFVASADIIVECSGDVHHGTEVIEEAHRMGLPVVTMNAELQVTTGSYFIKTGYITEAEGDQPGCLAALNENVKAMGFNPIVYGNIKGFLNNNPIKSDMLYWAEKQGFTLDKVVSFTDGTKVQIEQVLTANGLNATIAQSGLIGPKSSNVEEGALILAGHQTGEAPISDFIICPQGPPGVFIAASHEEVQKNALATYKMGEGPYYTIGTSFHLCFFEIVKTLRRVVKGEPPLLTNGSDPLISAAAIAKRKLEPGDFISEGCGSFEVRGEAVKTALQPDHIPIGLIKDAVVKRPVAAGKILNISDLELPHSRALSIWKSLQTASEVR